MNILQAFFNSFSKKEKIIFVLLVAVFLLSSIARAALAVQKNTEFVPIKGGRLNVGMVGQPSSINPVIAKSSVDSVLSSVVYSPLGKLSKKITTNNFREYTLTLKEDLKWSDGSSITSEDIIFTLSAIQNSQIKSPLYKKWKGVSVEKISSNKVRLNLPSKYVFFKKDLAELEIVPKHAFGSIPTSNLEFSSYNFKPISSEPYKFKEITRKKNGFVKKYTIEINENYSGSKPYIEELTFHFFKNKSELISAYKKRKIDLFTFVNPLNNSVRKIDFAKIKQVPTPRYYSVFFNPKSTSPFRKGKFRKALNSVIDKQAIVNNALNGQATPVDYPYTPAVDFNLQQKTPIKPKKVIRKMKNNNSDKKNKEIKIELTAPNVDFLKPVLQELKKQWKDAGIDRVKIETLRNEDFSEAVLRQRNYEALLFGNVLEHPTDLFPFWHSSQKFYPGLNLSFFDNSRVDKLLEEIRKSPKSSQRKRKFKKAVRIIKEKAPASFLFTVPISLVYKDNLEGIDMTSRNIIKTEDLFNGINNWYLKKVREFK
ncbi:MAG: ABC transporter substrate-binding protein [Candidatus Magasanikbacteria bacterium]